MKKREILKELGNKGFFNKERSSIEVQRAVNAFLPSLPVSFARQKQPSFLKAEIIGFSEDGIVDETFFGPKTEPRLQAAAQELTVKAVSFALKTQALYRTSMPWLRTYPRRFTFSAKKTQYQRCERARQAWPGTPAEMAVSHGLPAEFHYLVQERATKLLPVELKKRRENDWGGNWVRVTAEEVIINRPYESIAVTTEYVGLGFSQSILSDDPYRRSARRLIQFVQKDLYKQNLTR